MTKHALQLNSQLLEMARVSEELSVTRVEVQQLTQRLVKVNEGLAAELKNGNGKGNHCLPRSPKPSLGAA